MEKQQKQDPDPELRTETGEAYDIPEGGSLGLLALGYSGVMLWRQKRASANKQPEKTVEKPQ
ncbi:MAG: PEP-CTERM sorting domain-containing protein [Saprospiraceae bacterium]|nr:PEP-CTERM sorting domain-containing protein [Saprospiraceae bacterium]